MPIAEIEFFKAFVDLEECVKKMQEVQFRAIVSFFFDMFYVMRFIRD